MVCCVEGGRKVWRGKGERRRETQKGEREKEGGGGGIDRRRMKRIEMNEDERDILKLARDNEEGGLKRLHRLLY